MTAIRYPKLQDAEWLRQEYEVKLRTTTEIALEVGCKASAVSYHLRQHGIRSRPRSAPHGIGHRRRLRVRRDVICQASRDRQEELEHAKALPGRLRDIGHAQRVGDPVMLRNSLIAVASLCEDWASLIQQKKAEIEPVLRKRKGVNKDDPLAPVFSRQVKAPAGNCRCENSLTDEDGLCCKCGK